MEFFIYKFKWVVWGRVLEGILDVLDCMACHISGGSFGYRAAVWKLFYHLGDEFGARRGNIYTVAAIMVHIWADIPSFRTMLVKMILSVGTSKTRTLVPGGAIGVQFKSNAPLIKASAHRQGFVLDVCRILRVRYAWQIMRSHR